MNVKRKKVYYKNSKIECVKEGQIIFYWVKKKTCLGVLDRRERDKYNATGLKEGGKIEVSTTVLHY